MTDKNLILDRLNRRDAQRIEKIQKAHKAKDHDDISHETEEYFTAEFKVKSEFIEEMLSQIPTLETDSLPATFDVLKREITELQKYVVNSSLFLKEFNMRKFLGIVQNLQSKIYECENEYVPRKKFGFNKKKVPKADCQKPADDVRDSGKKLDSSKWEANFFGLENEERQNLSLQVVEKRDVTLRNLKQCYVKLIGVSGTLHMTDISDCIILSGPVTTSIFIEKCENTTFVLACQQMRMHSSTKCDIYLHVTSKGIIEDCTEIGTAPYNLQYEGLDKHFEEAGLNKNINNFDSLDDFNWLAPDVPSPNWSVIPVDQRIRHWRKSEFKPIF